MGKFSEYKLQLKGMKPGVATYEYHLGKQFFANMVGDEEGAERDVRDADLDVKLTVEYKSDIYNLSFVITGTVTLLCDRCLDDLILPIDTSYNIAVEYGEKYNDESDTLLVIPESSATLNVAYMLYDTVELAIPIKHVHPMGKCNRAMTTLLKKHRAGKSAAGEDGEMMEELMEEMDDMGGAADEPSTDPRWDALKGVNTDDNDKE